MMKETRYFTVRHYCKTYLILIYLLTAIGLTPGGISTVRIYTERTTQLTTLVGRLSRIRTESGQTKLMMN